VRGGQVRFQQRVYALANKHTGAAGGGGAEAEGAMSEETTRLMHQTVQKVSQPLYPLPPLGPQALWDPSPLGTPHLDEPPNHRTIGLSDHRIIGSLDHWIIGPSDHLTI